MEISPVTSSVTSTYTPPPQPSPPEPELDEPKETEDGEAKGVIKNLLEGHYKGVADVRLRIVHYEELAALENQQLTTNADQGVTNLLTAVGAGVEAIPEPGETNPSENEGLLEIEVDVETDGETTTIVGLYDVFVDTVNVLSDDFHSSATPSVNTLVGGIENAFADFIASLQDLLLPPAEETPAPEEVVETTAAEPQEPVLTDLEQATEEQDVVIEEELSVVEEELPVVEEEPLSETLPPEEPTSPDYQGLIDDLSNIFQTAITQLRESLNGSSVLPALSEPTGNGKAYDKFLEIYNDLWSVQPADAPPDGDEPLDLIT